MSCLGVLFALDEPSLNKLKKIPRNELPDYIGCQLEEEWFSQHPDLLAELDKSWDAAHRALTDGNLLFGDGCSPLSGVILGGTVLYGDKEGEEDYIITLKSPQQVKAISSALKNLTKEDFRRRYFAIDEEAYEHFIDEDDFNYTWDWLEGSFPLWEKAAQEGLWMLFTVDQ